MVKFGYQSCDVDQFVMHINGESLCCTSKTNVQHVYVCQLYFSDEKEKKIQHTVHVNFKNMKNSAMYLKCKIPYLISEMGYIWDPEWLSLLTQ